jgi:hypothetical protein
MICCPRSRFRFRGPELAQHQHYFRLEYYIIAVLYITLLGPIYKSHKYFIRYISFAIHSRSFRYPTITSFELGTFVIFYITRPSLVTVSNLIENKAGAARRAVFSQWVFFSTDRCHMPHMTSGIDIGHIPTATRLHRSYHQQAFPPTAGTNDGSTTRIQRYHRSPALGTKDKLLLKLTFAGEQVGEAVRVF